MLSGALACHLEELLGAVAQLERRRLLMVKEEQTTINGLLLAPEDMDLFLSWLTKISPASTAGRPMFPRPTMRSG